MSGSGCAGVVFPIMINQLLARLSFGSAVRATAYLVLGLLFIANCLMTIPKPASPRPKQSGSRLLMMLRFLREKGYAMNVAGQFFCIAGLYFPIFYSQLYSVQHKVDPVLAFYSIAIINAMTVVGRLAGNFLCDFFGPFTIMIPCAIITGATEWAFLGVSDRGTLATVCVLYGLASGAVISLTPITNAIMAKNPSEIGARNGLSFFFIGVATLVAGPIQGALLTESFKWIRPIAFSGSLSIGSCIFLLAARTITAAEKKTQKV